MRRIAMDALSTMLKPLALLEKVAGMDHPATLAEIAEDCDVPKPTVHRWLGSLTNAGLLQRTPDGRRFELASRATRLAFAILSNGPSGALRHEILQSVVREVGESCNLTILRGAQVIYLDRVESKWPLRITFQPGSNVPAHCSASGKLFLALLPASRRERIIRELTLEKFTEKTIIDAAVLRQEFTVIRRQSYSVDREEYLSGLICLAVPVFKGAGRSRTCIAALALQAPVARFSYDQMVQTLPTLQRASSALSVTLE
jgi:IclR family acetate operon transcriptional repressor